MGWGWEWGGKVSFEERVGFEFVEERGRFLGIMLENRVEVVIVFYS